jgi:hypothetical protein
MICKIWKIQKKIVKRFEKYGRKASWIVKRYGKYGRKDGKDMKNTEENSEKKENTEERQVE